MVLILLGIVSLGQIICLISLNILWQLLNFGHFYNLSWPESFGYYIYLKCNICVCVSAGVFLLYCTILFFKRDLSLLVEPDSMDRKLEFALPCISNVKFTSYMFFVSERWRVYPRFCMFFWKDHTKAAFYPLLNMSQTLSSKHVLPMYSDDQEKNILSKTSIINFVKNTIANPDKHFTKTVQF